MNDILKEALYGEPSNRVPTSEEPQTFQKEVRPNPDFELVPINQNPAPVQPETTIQRILGPFGHILFFIILVSMLTPVVVQGQTPTEVSSLKAKPSKPIAATEADYVQEFSAKATKSGKSFKQPTLHGAALYYLDHIVYTIESGHSADGLETVYDKPIIFIRKQNKKGQFYWTTKTVPMKDWSMLTAPGGGSK